MWISPVARDSNLSSALFRLNGKRLVHTEFSGLGIVSSDKRRGNTLQTSTKVFSAISWFSELSQRASETRASKFLHNSRRELGLLKVSNRVVRRNEITLPFLFVGINASHSDLSIVAKTETIYPVHSYKLSPRITNCEFGESRYRELDDTTITTPDVI